MQNVFEMTFRDGGKRLGLSWTIEGAPKANLVILTGMLEHSGRYQEFAEYMNTFGFNVYCLDHYGQGLNVNEDKSNYTHMIPSGFSRLSKETDELVAKLRVSCVPTYLLGHSMGSFIAQDYIQRFPGHIDRVIIMGSCGKQGIEKIGYQLARLAVKKSNREKPNKFLANLILGSSVKSVKNRKTDCDWLSVNEDNVNKYIQDPLCGGIATGGFYREFLKGMARIYRKKFLTKIDKNVHINIISGQYDPVGLMTKGVRKLEKQYKGLGVNDVRVNIMENMRHEVLNETNKNLTYEICKDFLVEDIK